MKYVKINLKNAHDRIVDAHDAFTQDYEDRGGPDVSEFMLLPEEFNAELAQLWDNAKKALDALDHAFHNKFDCAE